jgi:hypothetical protein
MSSDSRPSGCYGYDETGVLSAWKTLSEWGIKLAFFLILQRSADQVEQKRTHKYCSSIFRSQQGGKMHLSAVHFSCLTLERIYIKVLEMQGERHARYRAVCLFVNWRMKFFQGGSLTSNIYVSSGAECYRLKFYSITPCTLPITRQSLARLPHARKKTLFSLARGVSDPLLLWVRNYFPSGEFPPAWKKSLQYKLTPVCIFSFAPSCWEKVQLYLINYGARCDGGVELNPT